jgi:hypothetical protein
MRHAGDMPPLANALTDQSRATLPDPVITPGEALAERVARARRLAADCVLLAVVTPPDLSADLIDRAIAHARDANSAAHPPLSS